MASAPATPPPTPAYPARLRRDPHRRVLGGVCAGLAARLGVDPLLVRVGFVAAALAGGIGVAVYALGWVAIPRAEPAAAEATPHARPGRGSVEVALGAGLILLSVLLVFRDLGIWFSDAVVWPLVLVAAGAALLWRQSASADSTPGEDTRWAAAAATPSAATATARAGTAEAGSATAAARLPRPSAEPAPSDHVRERAALVSSTGLGVALVIAAGLAFLQATGSLTAARDVVAAVLVVVVVLGIIFAPWVVRLWRSLTAERAERIRSQERAEMAAHVHDSVLQTLAMVQKRAERPREVAALARRGERELRSWLSDPRGADATRRGLSAALEEAAQEVELAHGVPVEVVAVGDSRLDASSEALVAAAREAMVNAAKFGDGSPVAVFAEASLERTEVFVRDRGPGFDPAAIGSDRHGVRESIVGRMERNGGSARVTSAPGAATEVRLTIGRAVQ